MTTITLAVIWVSNVPSVFLSTALLTVDPGEQIRLAYFIDGNNVRI
jgi:hypothetical protein